MSKGPPPQRYSVQQDDYDYEIGANLRIYCDGVEMKEVIEYDCAAGTLLRNKLDDNGRIQTQLMPGGGRETVTEQVSGEIVVKWRDEE